MTDLPPLALSVRQPWAWAIIHGGKVIENRSAGSIRAGGMDCRRIAIHAASAMKEKEYRWGAWRLERHGVRCPRPDALVRGAIIGAVDVVDIISESDSEWFGGQMGLVLEDPVPCDPIPAAGALGYFEWQRSHEFAPLVPWMMSWDRPNGDAATLDLFDDHPRYRSPPDRPFGTRKQRRR
ncbi:MAG: hypothetical protein AAGL89_06720 [Pseudomonadota bacterium]